MRAFDATLVVITDAPRNRHGDRNSKGGACEIAGAGNADCDNAINSGDALKVLEGGRSFFRAEIRRFSIWSATVRRQQADAHLMEKSLQMHSGRLNK